MPWNAEFVLLLSGGLGGDYCSKSIAGVQK